jgi:hypothetical protein
MAADLPNKKTFDPRVWLFWAAMVFAVAELIDAFSTVSPVTGIVYAVLVAACAWWLRMRPSRIPIILLLVLDALELAALIFIYPHATPPPGLWRSAFFVFLTTVVMILAILSLIRPRTAISP